MVNPQDIGSLRGDFEKIVSEAKFWSYMKHKEAQVRCAWYSLLSSLCALKVEVFLEATRGRSSSVLVGCLAEKDVGAVGAAWEAALHVLCHFGVCEQKDFEHSILPQLWCFLREGGRGNAGALYPCLLPMLSKFPRDLLQSSHFQLKFLDILLKSLFLENVKNSRMECDAILQAFFECFVYFCFNLNAEREVLMEKVLLQQVLPLIESSIYDEQCSHFISSKLYPQLGTLLCKMAGVSEGPCHEAFTSASTTLWTELYAIATKFYTRKKTDPPSRQLILLFRGLFDPESKPEKQSVRFEEAVSEDEAISKEASEDGAMSKISAKDHVSSVASESDAISKDSSEDHVSKVASEDNASKVALEGEASSKDSSEDNVSKDSSEDNVSKVSSEDNVSKVSSEDNVSKVASEVDAISKDAVVPKTSPLMKAGSPSRGCLMKMLAFLYEKLCEDFDVHLLKTLKELMTLTRSTEVFRELLTLVNKLDASEFLREGFLRWLTKAGKSVDCIVDVVFLVCRLVSEDEGLAVLHGCCGKKDVKFLGKILNRARTCFDKEPFRIWLQNLEWMDVLLDALKDKLSSFPNGKVDSHLVKELQSILNLCLTDAVLRKIITSGERDQQLLHIIREGFRNLPENDFSKDSDVVFFSVGEIVQTLLRNVELRQAGGVRYDIVTLLFYMYLDLGWKRKRSDFRKAAWAVWDAAISNRKLAVGESLILQIARKIHSELVQHPSREDFLTHVPEIVRNLSCSLEKEMDLDLEDRVLEVVLLSEEEWDVVRRGLFVSNLTSHVENKIFQQLVREGEAVVSEDRIKSLIAVSEVCADLLAGKCTKSRENELFFSRFLLDQVSHVLWSISFCTGNGFVTNAVLAASKSEELCKCCEHVLSRLPADQLEDLVRLLFARATNRSCGWPATLSVTLELLERHGFAVGGAVGELLGIEHGARWCGRARDLNTVHGRMVVQLLLHHLPTETKLTVLEDTHAKFKTVDPASDESHDLLGDLCCILEDSEISDSDLGKDVARSIFAVLPLMDAESNFPLFVLQSTSVLRSVLRQTGGLDEGRWRLLERVFADAVEQLVETRHLAEGDLLHLYCVACLGLVLFEHAARFAEKSYAPFPRDYRPTLDSSFYENFVLMFLQLSGEKVGYPPLPRAVDRVMATLQQALRIVPGERIFRWAVEGRRLGPLVDALSSTLPRIQFAAHSLTMKLLPLLATTAVIGEDEEGTFPPELNRLLDFVTFSGELVTGLLREFRIGDVCDFVPLTDAYQLAVGFLLAWLEIFEFLSSSPAQLRAGRIECLSERKLLPALFSDVFRLLPDDPETCVEEGGCLSSLFLADSAPGRFEGPPSPGRLHALACLVYATALRKTPACVRTWFNNLDKRSADVVTDFTRRYLSGLLIVEELRPVSGAEARFEGMEVRARPGQREVSASYRVDDCDIELCVRLPPDFPLAPVAAERRGHVAVAQQEWRTWLMQLTTVLNYQDGSILDGLGLWKRNLDKKFEGVEECMICYYILHNATLKLPKLSCHTCRKKFHSACLYKWFHTSNNSTCPLCRNEFIM
ncbi:E3 ubiquitin-protein ligase listerin-like [Uloborus diversus]|uniref:E3 ubiquitin-protein ligase listerin-like n=1 Tax=Uloborus diversus TaxID=327109 RepID=UPI0024099410|nr:E3 ubiquitin-protein ligase listerin-like [Uloborus diversus]